ncbi:MAG TPA: phosphoadenylyl-sulfate reductase [Vicinamibacterales bacterium]|nr:phosphoadenylyl-sulfate reductase [Vicinamibacterales bacterium]
MTDRPDTRAAEALARVPPALDRAPAPDLLRWALDTFGSRIALAASFGAEDVVLVDMLARLSREARVFTLDTGRLPQETYDLMDRIRERYALELEVFCPAAEAVESMVRRHGANLFYRSVELRKLCCGVRKVEPLARALAGLDAWITGLRREQAPTRRRIARIEWDEEHGLLKLNPLADWTWDDVWAYIRRHDVPYNALHDRGYPSIGCACCTRAVAPGEDPRAGRWWWEADRSATECGLHARS